MKAVYIIVEGPTEEEFVNSSLRGHLLSNGIYDLRPILVGGRGGDVRYSRFKPNVVKLLKERHDLIVTSLIDYFRLKNDFPGYAHSRTLVGSPNRVEYLEQACFNDIGDQRFIPYIQLHEFEGLLFSDTKGFRLVPDLSPLNLTELNQTVQINQNPELIDDGPTTAPSKRLERLIPGYQKTLHGPIIALENGLDSILVKCPRFRDWINKIIIKAK